MIFYSRHQKSKKEEVKQDSYRTLFISKSKDCIDSLYQLDFLQSTLSNKVDELRHICCSQSIGMMERDEKIGAITLENYLINKSMCQITAKILMLIRDLEALYTMPKIRSSNACVSAIDQIHILAVRFDVLDYQSIPDIEVIRNDHK